MRNGMIDRNNTASQLVILVVEFSLSINHAITPSQYCVPRWRTGLSDHGIGMRMTNLAGFPHRTVNSVNNGSLPSFCISDHWIAFVD